MGDSQILMSIYRQYLEITAQLVELLEKNCIKETNNKYLKDKRQEFILHAQQAISGFHNDLHTLFKIAWELHEIEQSSYNSEQPYKEI
jgi:hypothetical protein